MKERILAELYLLAREYGMTKLSRATGIDRSHLYLTLRPQHGNPELNTLVKVCEALGVNLELK